VIKKKQKATKKENLINTKYSCSKIQKHNYFEIGKYVLTIPYSKKIKTTFGAKKAHLKDPQGGQMITRKQQVKMLFEEFEQ